MTTDLENELMAAKRRIEDLQIQLDMAEELVDVYKHRVERAYTERSYATAALARMALRAGLEAGTGLDDTPGMDEFSTILYVDTPAGQVSWHYKDDDLWLLDGLPRYEKPWDGTSRSKDGSFAVWDQKSNDDDELTDKAFKFGYTLACCTLVHMHDQPGMAKDVLKDIGLTRADTKAMNLTDFDAKLLRKIERSPGHGELYTKKKRKT